MTREELLEGLPPVWAADPLPALRQSILETGRTIVALDDDPTGTQTVYDVPVLTTFDPEVLRPELELGPPLLFWLTNSRSLGVEVTRELHMGLGLELRRISEETGQKITVISRSDSTLRGHYPTETDALQESLGLEDAITLLVPFFEAGGRITVNNVHYVVEGGHALPAAETPFAKDTVFGYRSSHLPTYVEEKTLGRVSHTMVQSLSIDLIRTGGPEAVAEKLMSLPAGSVCVANSAVQRDVEVVAAGAALAESRDKQILARTAASYVQARAGLANRGPLETIEVEKEGKGGGLVVVGSHVPKTTAQLAVLREKITPEEWFEFELPVRELLSRRIPVVMPSEIAQVLEAAESGRHCLIYTSRDLIEGTDDAANLQISKLVSESLTTLTRLFQAPRFVVAKGGITSSNVVMLGLESQCATVLGSIVPGVPLWQLGDESRFPGLNFVPFPGNTGADDALWEAVQKLTA